MKSRLSGLTLAAVLMIFGHTGLAQRSVELSGIIESQDPLAEGTRVAIHLVDRDGVWGEEIATVTPVAGTFSIAAGPLEGQELRSFRSGAVLLPGLQNEYRVSPENVNYTLGRVNMYVDNNGSGLYERVTDANYVGVTSLDEPVGFFSLIYLDRAATLSGAGVTLELAAGWNIFAVRFPGEGAMQFAVHESLDDLVLTVVLP
jgi:hypothetical protein